MLISRFLNANFPARGMIQSTEERIWILKFTSDSCEVLFKGNAEELSDESEWDYDKELRAYYYDGMYMVCLLKS